MNNGITFRVSWRILITYKSVSRLESLENPAKPPIVIYKSGGHWDKFKAGLEPADQVLVDRLKKLKDGDAQVAPPTTEEIRRRLAILKDQDPGSSQQSINVINWKIKK